MTIDEAHRSREILLGDIRSQAAAITACRPQLREQARRLAPTMREAEELVVVGNGDSRFAAACLGGLTQNRLGRSWRVVTPEHAVRAVSFTDSSLAVAVSFSGRSTRTLDAIGIARAAGAASIGVTADAHGPLAKAVDDFVTIPWRADSRAIPHASDFTTTLLALAVLLEAVGPSIDAMDRLEEVVEETLVGVLSHRDRLAADLLRAKHIYLLGSGHGLAVGEYGAAKLWEAGGYPAWACDLEEFGHGLHLTVRPGDVAIVIDAEGSGDLEGVLAGLRSLGVVTWTLGPVSRSEQHLRVSVGDPELTAFSAVVPLQFACLWLAEATGADVERPPAGPVDPVSYQRYRTVVADPTLRRSPDT